ncbi:MAG TPA: aminoglycoside adenylyltransferase domain-containing protein [Acidimicrobiales bacterium]|nr:aminoglycoside adenylyltransferase domain-containing protein [Acidimicrobiales bacterium]
MPVPNLVRELCGQLLIQVDGEAPGLITGLYLVGSLALGGYREGISDVDFIAVASRPPAGDDLATLRRVHAGLAGGRGRPDLDGVYVQAADLHRGVRMATGQVRIKRGEVRTDDDSEPNPVSLFILRRHGLAFRGPNREDLGVPSDGGELARWSAADLKSYWAPWVESYARSVRPTALSGGRVQWGVLGVSRLHYTLVTGEVTTKEDAARHAARRFGPAWHDILDEALRLRKRARGTSYRTPGARRRDAVDFIRTVIADGQRVAPTR